MKYVIFTYDSMGCPIAQHLQEEGNEVIIALVEKKENTLTDDERKQKTETDPLMEERRLQIFDGIVKKLPATKVMKWLLSLPEGKRKDYFLFFDFNNLFRYAERLAGQGFMGNFPTQNDRIFENDRDKAIQFVNENYLDLKVAEVKEFKTIEEGISFIEETDGLWVLKGNKGGETMVPQGDEEQAKENILTALKEQKKDYETGGFILQRLIVDPIEITPQMVWLDGKRIYSNVNIETKYVGNYDTINQQETDHQAGCSTSFIVPTSLDSEINTIAFPPICDTLAQNHKGLFVWDASILFDPQDNTPYFGEFCPNRFGYDALYAELSLLDSSTEWFEKLAKGENPLPEDKVSFAIRIFSHHEDKNRYFAPDILLSWDKSIDKELWLTDEYKDKEGVKTVGTDDGIAVISACGSSPEEAIQNCYENVKKFNFEQKAYRTDGLDYFATSILIRYNYLIENGLL